MNGWYLYEFYTEHPCGRCGKAHPLYIGKSNDPLRRMNQHMNEKWWRPMVSGWRVLPGTYRTEEQVLAAERSMILDKQPLANSQHNMGNPCRLESLPRGFATAGSGSALAVRMPSRTPRPQTGKARRPLAARERNTLIAWAAVAVVVAGIAWWGEGKLNVPVKPGARIAVAGGAGVGGSAWLWAWVKSLTRARRLRLVRHGIGWALLCVGVMMLLRWHSANH